MKLNKSVHPLILVLTYYTVYLSIYANITGKGIHRKKLTVFFMPSYLAPLLSPFRWDIQVLPETQREERVR